MSDFEVSLNPIRPSPDLPMGASPPDSFDEYDCLPEEGVCYFCKGPCNPCSQACGSCIRKPRRLITKYDIKDNFLRELKEAYEDIYKILKNKPGKFYLHGITKKPYNRKKYRRGIDNLKRSLRYFFDAYATSFSELGADGAEATPPPE